MAKKAETREVETALAVVRKFDIQLSEHEVALTKRTIVGEADFSKVLALRAEINAIIKAIDEQRKALVGPLNGVVKTINAKFKPATQNAEVYLAHYNKLLLGFEEAKRAEALREAEKEARRAEKKGAEVLAADIREMALTRQVTPGGVSYVDNWKAVMRDEVLFLVWVLENPKDRLNYVVLDPKPLSALAKSTNGKATVPGVEMVNDKFVKADSSNG